MRALALALVFLAAPAIAQDEVMVPAVPGGLALTVYGGDMALVRDRRPVQLRRGANRLVFENVSRAILPESVTLRSAGTGLRLIERSFDRDLLTPQALLSRSVGSEVWVQRVNPASGAVERRRGILRAVDGPALVEIDGRTEMVEPAAIAFDAVPAGLRPEPALEVGLEAAQAGRHDLELGYLTQGLSWRADYVMELAPDAPRMSLDAVATVSNDSGTSFRDVALALAAGDVNRVPAASARGMAKGDMMMTAAPAEMMRSTEASRQTMAAAHLYRFDHIIDLPDRQTKQLTLFSRPEVVVERQYLAPPIVQVFHHRLPQPLESNASLELVLHNTTAAKLGLPLPAGVARIYLRDAQGELRFQGEDQIGEVAEGEEIRLEVGRDFDLPVRRLQTEFKRLSDEVSESAYEVRLRNAKNEEVTVRVQDSFGGDWQIVEESVPHTRESAQMAVWPVKVPAKGEAVLTYRLRIRGF